MKSAEDEARLQAEKAASDAAAEEKPALKRQRRTLAIDAPRKRKNPRPKQNRAETRYGRKELHVAGDKSGRRKRKAPMRRRSAAVGGDSKHGFEMPTAPVIHEVEIPESISVAELAQKMAIKGNEVVKVLFNMGAMVTINQVIDQDTATLVVEELGHTAVPVESSGG